MIETIAALPRTSLAELLSLGNGFLRVSSDVVGAIEPRLRSVERSRAEQDLTLKQPIPYVVILRGSDVWLMRRLKGGAESRLHGALTVGVGGHVDSPFRVPGCIEDTVRREWGEEVHVDVEPQFEWLGVVNDDSVEVGRYHVGLVYVVRLPAGTEVRVGEPHKLEGWWEDPVRALARGAELETWSTYVLQALAEAGGGSGE